MTAPAVAAAADAIQQVAEKAPAAVNPEPASSRFAARLRSAAAPAADAPVADLFAVRLVREEPADAPQPGEAPSDAAGSDQFRLAHRVTALASGRNAYAVVNGRTVRLGDAIEGFVLVEVTREAAVFESGGVRVALSVVAER